MSSELPHIRLNRTRLIITFLLIAGVAVAAGSGTAAAASEANVTVSDVPQTPVQPGESFDINVSLTNTGDASGTVTNIQIKNEPDGVTAPDPPLSLNALYPGETSTKQVTVSVGENVSDGEYSLTAFGQVASGVTDTTPVNFTVSSSLPLNVSLSPEEIPVDETTSVTVTVTEAGTGTPVPTANITRLATVKTTPVNASGSAVLTFSPSETGNITLDITADGYLLTTRNISVTDDTVDIDRFDNEGNGIDRGDAVKAIVAYNTGTKIGGKSVSRGAAVQAIIAFNTGS